MPACSKWDITKISMMSAVNHTAWSLQSSSRAVATAVQEKCAQKSDVSSSMFDSLAAPRSSSEMGESSKVFNYHSKPWIYTDRMSHQWGVNVLSLTYCIGLWVFNKTCHEQFPLKQYCVHSARQLPHRRKCSGREMRPEIRRVLLYVRVTGSSPFFIRDGRVQ